MNQLPKKTFAFGTQYYRMVPMREDWERDIKRIKEMGMDSIRYWALWKWAEPVAGKFYFDDLHELVQLAKDNGLDVILVLEMDKVPFWLREMVPNNGLTNLDGTPDANEWGYVNWDHPVIRKLGERFLNEICHQFKHYGNIIWDVWNEPDKPEDSGKISRTKFLKWLKPRYESFEDFRRILHLPRYESWEDIRMPASTWDTQLYLLYQEFRTWSVAEQVRWAYEIVKHNVGDQPVTVHVHCDEHPFTFRWFGNKTDVGWDDWEMHKQVDFYITAVHEFYQGEGAYTQLQNISAVVSNLETKRSITGGQYWTTGLAGGASKLGGGLLTGINPGENLFSLWMCVAHEAKGVVYWQYRVERLLGPEAPGWGLAAFDGGETYRTKECEEFISALRPFEDGIMASKIAEPKAAVLYSLKSHIMNETQPHLQYIIAFEGACYTLYMNNIPFKVVSEKDSFEGLETILVPMAQCLENQTLDRLREFVANGGTLVLEAATGAYDEVGILNTHIPGGKDFSAITGIQEKDILYADEFTFQTDKGELGGVKERRIFAMADGVEIIGTWPDGEPAATRYQYGDGTVVYFSTNLFMSIRRLGGVEQTRTLADLIGLEPEIKVTPLSTITARVLENDTERYLFVFNHSSQEASAEITLPFEINSPEIVHQGKSSYTTNGKNISVLMPHRDTLVLKTLK
jgi:beta-galactosidase